MERVLRLLVMLILPGIPLAAWNFYLTERERQAEEEAREEELKKSIAELRVRLEKEEGGEAFRRLFGMPPAAAEQQSDLKSVEDRR